MFFAGPVAQAFARLGSQVTLVGRATRILGRDAAELADMLSQNLQAEDMRLLLGEQLKRLEPRRACLKSGKTVCKYLFTSDSQRRSAAFRSARLARSRPANRTGNHDAGTSRRIPLRPWSAPNTGGSYAQPSKHDVSTLLNRDVLTLPRQYKFDFDIERRQLRCIFHVL